MAIYLSVQSFEANLHDSKWIKTPGCLWCSEYQLHVAWQCSYTLRRKRTLFVSLVVLMWKWRCSSKGGFVGGREGGEPFSMGQFSPARLDLTICSLVRFQNSKEAWQGAFALENSLDYNPLSTVPILRCKRPSHSFCRLGRTCWWRTYPWNGVVQYLLESVILGGWPDVRATKDNPAPQNVGHARRKCSVTK